MPRTFIAGVLLLLFVGVITGCRETPTAPQYTRAPSEDEIEKPAQEQAPTKTAAPAKPEPRSDEATATTVTGPSSAETVSCSSIHLDWQNYTAEDGETLESIDVFRKTLFWLMNRGIEDLAKGEIRLLSALRQASKKKG